MFNAVITVKTNSFSAVYLQSEQFSLFSSSVLLIGGDPAYPINLD